jgi:RND family efflux transporter MFP subunit
MLDRAALKILHGDGPAGADPMADSRSAADPPRALGIWILVVVGLLGAGGGLSWWTLGREEAVPVEITRVLKAASPAPAGRSQTLNASGYVVARRMATVSANVTGKIAELYVEEGDSVTEGQPLARLDGTISQAKVDLEEGRLQLARAKLQEVEARLAQRSRELKRLQVLAAKKLTSESSYDAILGEVQALDAGLTAAKMEIKVGQRQLDLSRRELEELVIRAPFAGVVVSQTAQRGEVVSPISAADSYTRTGISTVVDMSSLELEVDVNESYIDRVSPKQATMAVLEAYPDWRIPGQVVNTVPTVNRQKGTVKVCLVTPSC